MVDKLDITVYLVACRIPLWSNNGLKILCFLLSSLFCWIIYAFHFGIGPRVGDVAVGIEQRVRSASRCRERR